MSFTCIDDVEPQGILPTVTLKLGLSLMIITIQHLMKTDTLTVQRHYVTLYVVFKGLRVKTTIDEVKLEKL